MLRNYLVPALAITLASTAAAQVTTNPQLFEAPLTDPAGTFHWDTFTGSFPGPHAPDVTATGTGSASISADGFVPQPMDGPPFGLVTSTSNLYSGGTAGTYTLDLTGLDDDADHTTVVLQLAYLPGNGPLSDFALDGLEPTELVDRGVMPRVEHGLSAAPFDTTFLWLEWQLDAADSYQITFDSLQHTSLASVRLDYVNADTVIDAAAPGPVPEPASLTLLTLAALVTGTRRRSRGASRR